jgi:hypothetical protein
LQLRESAHAKGFEHIVIGQAVGMAIGYKPWEIEPGDRNPIEGKFGQAKVRCGMDLIRARLKDTSESWVAMILVVINLVRMTREAPYFWLRSAVNWMCDIPQKIIRRRQINRMLELMIFRCRLKLIQ